MCYKITICVLLVLLLPKASSLLTARVVNGTGWAGRLEILYNGTWGTVCDDEFTNIDAQVACRMLGFTGSGAVAVSSAMYGQGQGNILLDDVGCHGIETSLEQCPHRGYYRHNCRPSEDVGVICNNRSLSLYIVVAANSAATSYPLLEGTSVTLKCERTQHNQTMTQFTWPETAGGRPSGEYLTFDNVTRDHNGKRVKCEGSYLFSVVRQSSEILELQAYYRPFINVTSKDNACKAVNGFPNHCAVTEGDKFTLQCEADSNPPPATITWSGRAGNSSGQLSIVSANRVQHSGEYVCTVATQSRTDDTRLPLRSSHRLTVVIKCNNRWLFRIVI
ncbi:uncharacterized protein LOC112567599 [Pomacea canaliculata]|uniref:uncharacterized protein LOC112567599 n=1 Tax=Pomacea canaliculata TaxID=400727 RepID=UPI000D735E64|nr:uncharacterized protein LOC112567599 [Pomacea canaliculata]